MQAMVYCGVQLATSNSFALQLHNVIQLALIFFIRLLYFLFSCASKYVFYLFILKSTRNWGIRGTTSNWHILEMSPLPDTIQSITYTVAQSCYDVGSKILLLMVRFSLFELTVNILKIIDPNNLRRLSKRSSKYWGQK